MTDRVIVGSGVCGAITCGAGPGMAKEIVGTVGPGIAVEQQRELAAHGRHAGHPGNPHRSAEVQRDILKLETADGHLTLKLGKPAQARRWADFIRASR